MIEPLVPISILAALVSALAGFVAGRASALQPQWIGVRVMPRRH